MIGCMIKSLAFVALFSRMKCLIWRNIVTLQLFSLVSFQMCSRTTRQNRFKIQYGHWFYICKENFLKSLFGFLFGKVGKSDQTTCPKGINLAPCHHKNASGRSFGCPCQGLDSNNCLALMKKLTNQMRCWELMKMKVTRRRRRLARWTSRRLWEKSCIF